MRAGNNCKNKRTSDQVSQPTTNQRDQKQIKGDSLYGWQTECLFGLPIFYGLWAAYSPACLPSGSREEWSVTRVEKTREKNSQLTRKQREETGMGEKSARMKKGSSTKRDHELDGALERSNMHIICLFLCSIGQYLLNFRSDLPKHYLYSIVPSTQQIIHPNPTILKARCRWKSWKVNNATQSLGFCEMHAR